MTYSTDILAVRSKLTPNRDALYDVPSGVRYTFAQLNDRANRAANFLQDKYGVQKGDRVSILAHNSVSYVDLLFGLGKIGAVLAPLNWRLTSRELTYIVNDCQPKVLIVGPEFVSVLDQMRSEINVEHVISLEGAKVSGAQSYEELLEQASANDPVRPIIDENDAYCILYTSGTTGRPKGAILPHRFGGSGDFFSGGAAGSQHEGCHDKQTRDLHKQILIHLFFSLNSYMSVSNCDDHRNQFIPVNHLLYIEWIDE